MSSKNLIPINRFNHPNYYSKILSEATKEFQEDISKVYTAGYSYSQVITNAEIKRIHKYLYVKFTDQDGKSKFPYLARFVNYVFTRDETYNPFGKWMRFEYLQPLMLLEFAREIAKDSGRQRLSLTTVASTIFVLFQYYGVTTMDEVRDARGRLIEKYGSRKRNENDQRCWNILIKCTRDSNRSIITYKPQYIYNLIGVADYRTFEDVIKLLNVHCGYFKRYKSGFKSVLVIGEIKQLMDRFDSFVQQNSLRYNELKKELSSKDDSGIKLPISLVNGVNTLYEKVLIRDKRLPSLQYLNNNPLIRITTYNKREYFHIQSDFYDFGFILASLYLKNNKSRRSLKLPIGDLIDKKSSKVILESARKAFTDVYENIIKENNISTCPKCISSPLDRHRNTHFKQIDECGELINSISNNGIGFDVSAAASYLQSKQSLKREALEGGDFNIDQTRDNILDLGFEDESFPFQDKKLSAIEKVEEIEKLINSLRVGKKGEIPPERIYGIFTPHGASTHRMTSHNFNLQGISKEIKQKLMIAPEGRSLLSADVSGQDITVAANLANKLYNSPSIFKEDLHEKFIKPLENITQTMALLADYKSSTSKPIDYILDNIISTSTFIKDGWDRMEIRDQIKSAVYTFFYGGGKESYLNSSIPEIPIKELMAVVVDECKTLEEVIIAEFRLGKFRRLHYGMLSPQPIEQLIARVESYLNRFQDKYYNIIKSKHYIYQTQVDLNGIKSRLEKVKGDWRKREANSFIYDRMKDVLQATYPGILESFDYFKLYYQEQNLTYPTFLNWQTVVSLEYNPGKILTKSKSYPVQASGAEFIRQWLIELNRDMHREFQGEGVVKIVNVIHDQIVLDVDDSVKEQAKVYLIASAKRAAEAIGIVPETLHIHEVIEINPRNDLN